MTVKDALIAELNKSNHPALKCPCPAAGATPNINWAQLIQIILAILEALNPPTPTPAPTPTPTP